MNAPASTASVSMVRPSIDAFFTPISSARFAISGGSSASSRRGGSRLRMPGRSGSGIALSSKSVEARWLQTAARSQDGDEHDRPACVPCASDAHPWAPAGHGRRRRRR